MKKLELYILGLSLLIWPVLSVLKHYEIITWTWQYVMLAGLITLPVWFGVLILSLIYLFYQIIKKYPPKC